MQTFVINLASERTRRAHMARQLDALGMPYTLVEAIDGKQLSQSEMAQHYDAAKARAKYREITSGEIGCALSHLHVYRTMQEHSIPFALVLEDDVILSPQLLFVLPVINRTFSEDQPAVVFLHHLPKYNRWGIRPLTEHVSLASPYTPPGFGCNAHGYCITRVAAKYLLSTMYPVWTPADVGFTFERKALLLKNLVPFIIDLSELSQQSSLSADRERAIHFPKTVRHYLKPKPYRYRKLLYQLLHRPFAKTQTGKGL